MEARVDDEEHQSDGELVEAARGGEDEAFALLVDRYLDRCWNVAWRILHDRDDAADVAQESMATAWEQLPTLESPGSFGGWVLRIARNRALNRLDHERRAVPVDDDRHLEPTDRLVVATGPEGRIEEDERAELLWGAAVALGERDVSVLDLHLRHGLGPAELAEELDVTPNNAHQVLFRLRDRLGTAIRAYVLWNHGRPRCEELAASLEGAGITSFGPVAVKAIERHVADCVTCEEERDAVLAPVALFSGVPLAVMPTDLRDRALAGLRGAGVPAPAVGSAPAPVPPEVTGGPLLAADRPDPEVGDEEHERSRLVVLAAVAAVVLAVIVGVLLWGPGGVDEPTVVAGVEDVLATASTATTEDTAPTPSVTAEVAPPVETTATSEPDEPAPGATPSTSPTIVDPSTTPTSSPDTTRPPDGGSTTSTSVPAPAPLARLRGVNLSTAPSCANAQGIEVTWTTSDATEVTLTVGDGAPEPVPASGTRVVCEQADTPVLLEAIGPGGVATSRWPAP